MLHLIKTDRHYSPEAVAAMTAAFDKVCLSLSTRINDDDEVRRIVALAILRLFDEGVSDPIRIADDALRQLTRAGRSSDATAEASHGASAGN